MGLFRASSAIVRKEINLLIIIRCNMALLQQSLARSVPGLLPALGSALQRTFASAAAADDKFTVEVCVES